MIRRSKLIQSIVICSDVGIPSVGEWRRPRRGAEPRPADGATATAAVTTISLFCLCSTFFHFDGFRRADARRMFYTYANYHPPPPLPPPPPPPPPPPLSSLWEQNRIQKMIQNAMKFEFIGLISFNPTITSNINNFIHR